MTPLTLPLTSSQEDWPEVLEHSNLRHSNIERFREVNAGEGIFVKLFPVLHQDMRSAGSPIRLVWIVRAPDTSDRVLSKQKGPQKTKARSSQAAKAALPYKQRASANVRSEEIGGQTLVASRERPPLVVEQQGERWQ
jgi:hypothetical protein